jgi:tight adherence protein B
MEEIRVMNEPILIPAILVFLAAVFGTLALALVVEALRSWWRRRAIAKRVEPVLSMKVRKAKALDDLVRGDVGAGTLAETISNLIPGKQRLEALLEQSRTDWSPWTFLIIMSGSALAAGLTALVITRSLAWFAGLAVLGALGPLVFLHQRRAWRFRQFEEEFPEAIELLTRAIRAGHPLSAALGMVADEGPHVVSTEFRQVFEEQRFGIPFEEALLGLVDRIATMDVRIFVIAVLVQRDVGGNLAETLENLAETIRKRFYLRRQLRVYTAQGRLTGYALGALPLVVGFGIFLGDPGYLMVLFTDPYGQLMLFAGALLQVFGVLWIRKIIDIDI